MVGFIKIFKFKKNIKNCLSITLKYIKKIKNYTNKLKIKYKKSS